MLRSRSEPNMERRETLEMSAKPFPAHIFTDRAYQRMREDEEFRALQRNLRQRALMSEAKLPPRMETEADVHLKRKLKKVTHHWVGSTDLDVPLIPFCQTLINPSRIWQTVEFSQKQSQPNPETNLILYSF